MKTKPIHLTLKQYKTNVVSLNICPLMQYVLEAFQSYMRKTLGTKYTFSDIPFPEIETGYEDNILFFSELDFVVDIPLKGFSC